MAAAYSCVSLQVSPNPPQYSQAPNGTYLKTKRAGSMMLSWAKANNSGYNYQNKAFFSLSPSEIGLLLELLDARTSEISLAHSPNMNAGEDDKTKRVLHISRTSGADGMPAVVFKFSGEIQAAAALNAGEARTLRELLVYSLPRLFGFHSVLEGPLNIEGVSPSGFSSSSNSNGNRPGSRAGGAKPAAEWPF
ncbi:Whirly isoform 1, partial [Globisporangium splendens]